MRKTSEITIESNADNRDAGKRFKITEMNAIDAEAWGVRALGAMMRAGIDIPDDTWRLGMAGFAGYGLKALLAAPYPEMKPLLDEMMNCVQIVETAVTRALQKEDIEEISTLTKLRDEVIKIHLGFSIAASLLEAMAARLGEVSSKPPTSSTSRTSRRGSRRSSPPA